MRSLWPLTALALASLSAVACTDGPTASGPVPSGLTVSKLSAPDASGPLVVRFTSAYVLIATFDLADGLLAIHGPRNAFLFCGESPTMFHPAQFQDVMSPADQDLVNELFRTEAFVTIYPWEGQDIEADLCGFLLGTPKIATGTAHLLRTDNNLFGAVSGRANAFGYRAEGILDLTGGGKAHYNAISRAVATPGGGFKVTEEINLVPLR
jgi:hypothetical protein